VVKDMSNRFAWLKMLFFTLSGLVLLGSSCNPPPSEETKIEYFRIDGKDEDVTIKVDSTDKSFELSWKVSNAAKCALGLNDRINQSKIRDVLCERTETVLADSLTTYTYTLNAYKTAGSQPTTNTSRKIIVEPASANLVPVANNDIYSVAKNATLTEPADRGVLANDTNNPSSAIIVTPLSGLTLNPDGSFTYNASGVTAPSVSFAYKARNSQGDSNVATVTISITDVGPRQVVIPISSSGDDTEQENTAAGNMLPDSQDLDFGDDDAAEQVYKIVGLRFQNVTIPFGANVTNAYIQFTANNDPSQLSRGFPTIDIALVNDINPPTFSVSGLALVNTPRTFFPSTDWQPASWELSERGVNQQANVTQQIQAAVNRPGWVSGNAIALILGNITNGVRVAQSFDRVTGASNRFPTLIIEYE
jgi:hypothetical protein